MRKALSIKLSATAILVIGSIWALPSLFFIIGSLSGNGQMSTGWTMAILFLMMLVPAVLVTVIWLWEHIFR